MLKKMLTIFGILLLSLFLLLPIFANIFVKQDNDKDGVYFFTEIAGLIIPHLTFFLVSYYWALIVSPAICGFFNLEKSRQAISFIPIFILWLFFFVIYVLDYGISFFYIHGGYDTLRRIDLL